jgi:hypothetical protein
VETGAWASAGQLWGTAGDICRWGAFLADPDEAVLAASSAEEMRTVQAIADHERWTSGYGLGLGLTRDGDRILAGHGGSMPGFIAQLLFSAKDKVVVAELTNESEADLGELGVALLGATVEEWPVAPEAWRIGEPPPDDAVPVLGIWFLEATRVVFRWREGKLEARADGMPDWQPSASSARATSGGAPSPGRSTARRCASFARRTARSSGWSGRATRSPASPVPGARPSSRYSYCSACSTLSLPARRAGMIAATRPARIAATTNTISVPHGIVKAGYLIAFPTISASTTPTGIPRAAPISAVMMLSCRIIRRTCRRVIPIARNMPSSRVRSKTVSTSVLTIPKRLIRIESESRT